MTIDIDAHALFPFEDVKVMRQVHLEQIESKITYMIDIGEFEDVRYLVFECDGHKFIIDRFHHADFCKCR